MTGRRQRKEKTRRIQKQKHRLKLSTIENLTQTVTEVKKSCKQDRKDWIESKCTEAQEAASWNDIRSLYGVVKQLTGVKDNTNVPIMAKDGHLLLTEREQNLRWKEHFEEVLNQPEPLLTADFGDTVMADSFEVYEGHINIEEVRRAVNSLTKNKAPGVDEISAEMLKHGKETVAEQLVELFNMIWQDSDVPADWKKGVIIKLPKKGSLKDCNNWRGITLLSTPGKVFSRLLLNRPQEAVDHTLWDE